MITKLSVSHEGRLLNSSSGRRITIWSIMASGRRGLDVADILTFSLSQLAGSHISWKSGTIKKIVV